MNTKYNKPLELLLNNQPNYDIVEKWFFEHWPKIHFLGGVNYSCFFGYDFDISFANEGGREEILAFWLLGAAEALSVASSDGTERTEDAWESVQYFLRQLYKDDDLADKIIEPLDFIKSEVKNSDNGEAYHG